MTTTIKGLPEFESLWDEKKDGDLSLPGNKARWFERYNKREEEREKKLKEKRRMK